MKRHRLVFTRKGLWMLLRVLRTWIVVSISLESVGSMLESILVMLILGSANSRRVLTAATIQHHRLKFL